MQSEQFQCERVHFERCCCRTGGWFQRTRRVQAGDQGGSGAGDGREIERCGLGAGIDGWRNDLYVWVAGFDVCEECDGAG